jgi:hypothetical protein
MMTPKQQVLALLKSIETVEAGASSVTRSVMRILTRSAAPVITLVLTRTFSGPGDVIVEYHDRMRSIHVKNKTGPRHATPNTNAPFGWGETPIANILLLLKKEKWPIEVDVELEYPIPEGSDAAKETKRHRSHEGHPRLAADIFAHNRPLDHPAGSATLPVSAARGRTGGL